MRLALPDLLHRPFSAEERKGVGPPLTLKQKIGLGLGAALICSNVLTGSGAPGHPHAAPLDPLAINDASAACQALSQPMPLYPDGELITAPHLTNHGQVLQNVRVVNVFAGRWTDARMQAVDAWTQDYAKSSSNQVLAGYGAPEASYGGSVVVPKVEAGTFDSLMAERVASDLANGASPGDVHVAQPNELDMVFSAAGDAAHWVALRTEGDPSLRSGAAVTVYNEIVAPGTVITDPQGDRSDTIGGYHDVATDARGGAVYFTVEVWPTWANGVQVDDNAPQGLDLAMGHELAEVRTDPIPGAGWVDASGAELADLSDDIVSRPNDLQCDPAGFPQLVLWSPVDRAYEIAPEAKRARPWSSEAGTGRR